MLSFLRRCTWLSTTCQRLSTALHSVWPRPPPAAAAAPSPSACAPQQLLQRSRTRLLLAPLPHPHPSPPTLLWRVNPLSWVPRRCALLTVALPVPLGAAPPNTASSLWAPACGWRALATLGPVSGTPTHNRHLMGAWSSHLRRDPHLWRTFTTGSSPHDKQKGVEVPKGLMPVTASEMWQNAQVSTLAALRSLPAKVLSLTGRAVVGTAKGTVELVRNPRVAVQWYKKGKSGLKGILHHYWVGSKLLAADVSIAFRLVRKVIRGYQLTRRERKQLINTVSDVFRLVPMAAFIIIPFMELLLPVALKLFPNMLPSTFQDKLKKEENMKRALKAKIEMARFLQDTVGVMAADLRKSSDSTIKSEAKELSRFIEKIRNGQPVENADLLRFSELFSDEITLDNLSRPQLVAMCRYMGLNTFGSDPVLRFRINNRLTSLKSDDRMIYWEGLSSLSTEELQEACMARGMSSKGLSKEQLRSQLSEWLELSMDHRIPSTLLIMSRAFVLTSGVYQALQQAVASLPDEVVETVSMESESAKENERRLEVLERQEELIEEEEDILERRGIREAEIGDESLEADLDMALRESDLKMTSQKIKQISEAVSVLAAASSVVQEKAELEEIQSDREDVLAKLLASRVLAPGHSAEEFSEDDVSKRVAASTLGRLGSVDKRLSRLIEKLDGEIRQVDATIGQGFNLIDQDRDGIVTVQELQTVLSLLRDRPKDDAVVQHIVLRLDPDGDGKVNVREIEEAMARLEEMNLLSDEEVEEENQRLLKQQQLRQSHSDAEGGSSGASGSSTSPPP